MGGWIGFLIFIVPWSIFVEIFFRKSVKENEPRVVTSPEFTEFLAIHSKKRLKHLKKNRTIAHLLPITLFGNLVSNLIPGWILIPLILIPIIQAFFRDEILRLDYNAWYPELRQSTDKAMEGAIHNLKEKKVRGKARLHKNRQIAILVAIGVSVSWAYQVNNDLKQDKENFTNELKDIAGNEMWCANGKLAYDNDGALRARGGWPCIMVGPASNVRFSEQDNIEIACAFISLNREIGFPGEDSYELNYRADEYCIEKEDGFTGFIEGKIYANVVDDLNQLEIDLCRKYEDSFYDEDFAYFCSGTN